MNLFFLEIMSVDYDKKQIQWQLALYRQDVFNVFFFFSFYFVCIELNIILFTNISLDNDLDNDYVKHLLDNDFVKNLLVSNIFLILTMSNTYQILTLSNIYWILTMSNRCMRGNSYRTKNTVFFIIICMCI